MPFWEYLVRGDGIFLPICWAVLILVIFLLFLHSLFLSSFSFFFSSLPLSPFLPLPKLCCRENEERWKSRDWGACETEENTECMEGEGGSDRMLKKENWRNAKGMKSEPKG